MNQIDAPRQIDVNKRQIGLTFTEHGIARLVVWAPLAGQVAVRINEQPSPVALEKEDMGYWCVETRAIKPGDRYKLVLNNEKELPSPTSLSQPDGVHGPSQAFDTSHFYWEDHSWVNPSLDDYILYELHTGTFTPKGTFAAIEEKLDHLKALGINAIEIMPVAQFPDSRNWGYDGVFPYAVQNSYGGPAGLQHLVNACHYRGIAVVLDVVYNHFGPEGNYLKEYGPYFTSTHCTPWGDAINFDDAWCDGARHYFIENALMWFRDFHIDALRLDAVHAIKDFSPTHILAEIKEHTDRLMAATGRQHYLIVESDLNDPRYIDPLDAKGYGMDAQWIDEFHHALRVSVGEERNGYYADFNGVGHLAKSYRDAYVYDGQFSETRQRKFGRRAEHNPGQQFVVFSQNHDQVGNRKLGERSGQLFSFETLKLMAGAVLVSPYIPLLFMGEEWGETNPFLYFVSHTDPELAEAVRKGRTEEFAAFHTDGEVPNPQAEETFLRSKLQWELLDQSTHQTLFRYYQAFIALRRQQPALRHLDREQLEVIHTDNEPVLALHRWYQSQHILCVLNFAHDQQSFVMPAWSKSWTRLIDSADPMWQGPGAAPGQVADGDTLTLQPESILIYTQRHD